MFYKRYLTEITWKSATAVWAAWRELSRATNYAKILGNIDASSVSDKQCNCRKKDLCPLDSACLTNNIVYKATVTTTTCNTRVYIGMMEYSFKTRFNNHKVSFKPANTRMTLSCLNTSGISRTATPISQSSGRLSRVQDLAGETRHAAICAWWKSSVLCPVTNQHFSTRDLSW